MEGKINKLARLTPLKSGELRAPRTPWPFATPSSIPMAIALSSLFRHRSDVKQVEMHHGQMVFRQMEVSHVHYPEAGS
jgi:hypothetical protein